MKQDAAAFTCGVIFSFGLGIGGMTNPQKVIDFLDFFGSWDPSLAFVMGGALGVNALAYLLIRGRDRPLFAPDFHVPTRKDFDFRLVAGAALFGGGWGLSGFCPGPALTTLGAASEGAAIFVVSMIAGMLAFAWFERPASEPEPELGGTV